ncbi:hypothetical protein MSG28_009005, partial [Choristoneura fumiferana]
SRIAGHHGSPSKLQTKHINVDAQSTDQPAFLVIDVCDTVTSVLVVVVSLSPTHFLLSHSFNTASSLNGCNTSFTLFGPVFTVDLSNLKLAVVFPSVEISVASVVCVPTYLRIT